MNGYRMAVVALDRCVSVVQGFGVRRLCLVFLVLFGDEL